MRFRQQHALRSLGLLSCLFLAATESFAALPSRQALPRTRVAMRVEGAAPVSGLVSQVPVTPILWTLGLGIIAVNLFGSDGAVAASRDAGSKWAANFGRDPAANMEETDGPVSQEAADAGEPVMSSPVSSQNDAKKDVRDVKTSAKKLPS
eukprot:TRINITY_DN82812_c0_g1_i1.p1 TRINITY_DN82812_c0_g1~~TRINITY_DN82812_c0_g1_i1.p1  ORF type:complete len:150 (-),score=29.41 TRINITY_DN82812_c0_g1_i1:196-645(-)